MTHMNRRHALGLMGAAAASTLAAPAIAANRKITVGALRFTSHSASFIGVERGYFAEAGLDVELKFFQHFTFEEIGYQLGISANTVKSRLYAALQKMKGQMEKQHVM